MIALAQYTIVDLCDPVVSSMEPPSPIADMLWLDTSKASAILKRWNGSAWELVNESSSGGRNLLLNSEDERAQERGEYNTAFTYDFSPLLTEIECDTFVFSFEAKADVEGMKVDFHFMNHDYAIFTVYADQVLTTEYKRYVQPVVMPKGTSVKDILYCRIRLMGAVGTAYFQRAMLERGNTASDWVCAPEDELNN